MKLNKEKIYARECLSKELSKTEFNEFIDSNHIQKSNNLSLIRYGLIHNNQLIAAISIGRHSRQNGRCKLILDRLCFKENIQIIGGANKLFDKCKKWAKNKGYEEIISFSDNRWSQGQVYGVMKFTLDKELPPSYDYVDLKHPTKRFSKQSKQKKRINCPDNIKEHIFLANDLFARIWDCGKKRWKYNINQDTSFV